MGKRESKSIDLRESVEKALKQGSRSKTLLLPKKGFVLKFLEEDDYFKALKDGSYGFKGLIEFLDSSEIVGVYDGVLKKVENGYLLEGDFSKGYVFRDENISNSEDFEKQFLASKEELKRQVAAKKIVLQTRQVNGEEKPTVVKYGFKTGRKVLYDLDREIIATGWVVKKNGGTYKVKAFGGVPGVVMSWEGSGSEGVELAKTTTLGEELLLDLDKKIVVTGKDISKKKGAYKVKASCDGEIPGVIKVWKGPDSEGKELAKTEKPDEELLLDLLHGVEIHGGKISVLDNDVYEVSSGPNIGVTVKIKGKTVLENVGGLYTVFKERWGAWYIVNSNIGLTIVLPDDNVEIRGASISLGYYTDTYEVSSITHINWGGYTRVITTPVTVKINGKTVLKNAKGTYKVYKKDGSWHVE
ncbi:hypothetical protein J7L02_02120 [Candidatus Woesearchaeota archaeon]|nr:hypothetical protein [Candidatus Woesearchaeota archaeon]